MKQIRWALFTTPIMLDGWKKHESILEQIGFGYDKLESDGIISPVIYVECDYKTPSTFGDTVLIEVEIEEFKGVKLIMKYTMTNVKTGELVLVVNLNIVSLIMKVNHLS